MCFFCEHNLFFFFCFVFFRTIALNRHINFNRIKTWSYRVVTLCHADVSPSFFFIPFSNMNNANKWILIFVAGVGQLRFFGNEATLYDVPVPFHFAIAKTNRLNSICVYHNWRWAVVVWRTRTTFVRTRTFFFFGSVMQMNHTHAAGVHYFLWVENKNVESVFAFFDTTHARDWMVNGVNIFWCLIAEEVHWLLNRSAFSGQLGKLDWSFYCCRYTM